MSVFAALGIGTGTLSKTAPIQDPVPMAMDATPRHQSFPTTDKNIEQKDVRFANPNPNPNVPPSMPTSAPKPQSLTNKDLSTKPTQPDPLQWMTWYIFSKQVNSCLVQTPYLDYEVTLQETKSKTGGKTMRLLNLCIYRADGQPVPSPLLSALAPPHPDAIASHRRLSIIEHSLKEIKIHKKQQPDDGIHGLVVYRLNFELLLPQNDTSYKAIVQRLQSQNEQLFEDTEQKVLYIKT